MSDELSFEAELKELFYEFHKYPELSYQEYETTKRIRTILKDAGIELMDLNLETGVVAIIRGDKPGPVIAIRSDIDALPVEEDSNLPYQSLIPGVMHACGHDFHMVVTIGAAMLLQKRKQELEGTIKVIFQPAEEAPFGADKIIETGAVDDVTEFFGLHTTPELPTGTIGIRVGAVMASVDRFTIDIEGKGSHAAHPHKGVDPIVTSAAIIQSLQTVISRNLDPFTTGLISVTHIESGNTWNVIPQKAFLEGTVRTLELETRDQIKSRMDVIVTMTAELYGAKAQLNWLPGPPAVINSESSCALAVKAAEKYYTIVEGEKTLTGEDFSLFLRNKKGAFLRVGTGGEYPLHHPRFTADPDAIKSAAYLMADLAVLGLLYNK